MNPGAWFRQYGPATLLMGAAVCVSCLTVIAVALSAFGLSILPYLPGLGTRILLALVLVGGAAAMIAYNRKRSAGTEACATDTPPHLRFSPRNAALSLVLSLGLVAGVALATQLAVGTFTRYSYKVNWLGSVPLLVLGMAWLINGWLNEREAASG